MFRILKKNKRSEKLRENHQRNYLGGDSAVVPPDPMPNSEVKRRDADGSVGISHVRVGHRQVLFFKFIHRVNLKNNFLAAIVQ